MALAVLSRAALDAGAAAARIQSLEAELASVTAATPAALASVRRQAATPPTDRDERLAQFASTVRTHTAETARLSERLGHRRARLQELRDGHLLLHTLVLAHDLTHDVEAALSSASPPASGVTSSPVTALLRLHALRAAVRTAASAELSEAHDAPNADAGELASASGCGPDGAESGSSNGDEVASPMGCNAALVAFVDAKVQQLRPALESAAASRLAAALAALGWPGQLPPAATAPIADWRDGAASAGCRTAEDGEPRSAALRAGAGDAQPSVVDGSAAAPGRPLPEGAAAMAELGVALTELLLLQCACESNHSVLRAVTFVFSTALEAWTSALSFCSASAGIGGWHSSGSIWL